jgi:hypothetical protein
MGKMEIKIRRDDIRGAGRIGKSEYPEKGHAEEAPEGIFCIGYRLPA